MKAARATRLADSEDPAIQALLETPAARQLTESQTRPRRLNDTIVTSTRCLRSALAQTLYQSVDGHGLVAASLGEFRDPGSIRFSLCWCCQDQGELDSDSLA